MKMFAFRFLAAANEKLSLTIIGIVADLIDFKHFSKNYKHSIHNYVQFRNHHDFLMVCVPK